MTSICSTCKKNKKKPKVSTDDREHYQPKTFVEISTPPGSKRGKREDTLILNLGPQHPSTHGVLRIIVELDGEYIVRAEPVIGYLHRMHEKMAEVKTAYQFIPNMGRVDYLHPLAWNWAWVLGLETLGEIEVPERAEYLRVITCELNRISSHLLWWGAYLLDLGAFTPRSCTLSMIAKSSWTLCSVPPDHG